MVVNNNGVIMKFIFASMIQQNFYLNKKKPTTTYRWIGPSWRYLHPRQEPVPTFQ